MRTKIFLIIIVLASLFIWFGYSRSKESLDVTEDLIWARSSAFVCDNGGEFVAEFAKTSEVKLIIGGETVIVLPSLELGLNRFGDTNVTYVFEENKVNIVDNASGDSVLCVKPVDPNNLTSILNDGEGLFAKWQSESDSKYVREFKGDGIVVDYYEGKIVSTGNWKLFSSNNPLKTSFELEEKATYLQIIMEGSQSEVFNFKLAELTSSKLSLIYMERGGTNVFKKIK